MTFLEQNNKFVTYLLILISLFIVVLFTRGQISLLQENLEIKEMKENTLEQKRDKVDELNAKKAELEKENSEIEKFLTPYTEDEIIEYIYGYIEKVNSVDDGLIVVKSIAFTEGELNEMGFKESNINLKIRVPNGERMKQFLDFLTSKESKYNFYVDSFSYPRGEIAGSFNVTIPLKVLYK